MRVSNLLVPVGNFRQETPQEGPFVEDLDDDVVAQEPALPFVSFEDID